MIPAGKTMYITDIYASVTDKSINMVLRATAASGVLTARVWHEYGAGYLNDSAIARKPPPMKMPALSMIKFTAYVPAGKAGGDASAGWAGWIE